MSYTPTGRAERRRDTAAERKAERKQRKRVQRWERRRANPAPAPAPSTIAFFLRHVLYAREYREQKAIQRAVKKARPRR